ncbi:MAG TPA: hypothetical protein VMV07_10565 [Streptosporangiaceae bacterium]|nr:hypothetical protein [Streptosporangiaceae bacterium]
MANPTDSPKVSWGLVIDTLDVFERHGFRKSDDAHLGRAVALLRDVVRIYSGELDQPIGPGISQPGGGWISGPSIGPSGAPRDPGPGA